MLNVIFDKFTDFLLIFVLHLVKLMLLSFRTLKMLLFVDGYFMI